MRALALLLPVLLSGCSLIQAIVCPEDAPGTQAASSPAPTAAPVGGSLYSEASYWSKTVNRLLEGRRTPVGMGEVAVADGDLVFKSRVEGRIAYCTEHPVYTAPSAGPARIACFMDADNDGKFETVTVPLAGIWLDKEIPQPVRYARTGQILPGADSTKYELLYAGTSNGSLRLSYREYLNDKAIPGAFLDVSYDFRQEPTTISFRNVTIDVLSADNRRIVYRVSRQP